MHLKVLRLGDCMIKASVCYCTEEAKENLSMAIEGEDYEPIKKADLDFDTGEVEKHIIIKLAEKVEE